MAPTNCELVCAVVPFGMAVSDIMFAQAADMQNADSLFTCSMMNRSINSAVARTTTTHCAKVTPFGMSVSDTMFARVGANRYDDTHGEKSVAAKATRPTATRMQAGISKPSAVIPFGMSVSDLMFAASTKVQDFNSLPESCTTTKSVILAESQGKTSSAKVTPFGMSVSDLMFARRVEDDDALCETSVEEKATRPNTSKRSAVIPFGMSVSGLMFAASTTDQDSNALPESCTTTRSVISAESQGKTSSAKVTPFGMSVSDLMLARRVGDDDALCETSVAKKATRPNTSKRSAATPFGMSVSDLMFAASMTYQDSNALPESCTTTRSVISAQSQGKTSSATVTPFGMSVSDLMFARRVEDDDALCETSVEEKATRPNTSKRSAVIPFGMSVSDLMFATSATYQDSNSLPESCTTTRSVILAESQGKTSSAKVTHFGMSVSDLMFARVEDDDNDALCETSVAEKATRPNTSKRCAVTPFGMSVSDLMTAASATNQDNALPKSCTTTKSVKSAPSGKNRNRCGSDAICNGGF